MGPIGVPMQVASAEPQEGCPPLGYSPQFYSNTLMLANCSFIKLHVCHIVNFNQATAGAASLPPSPPQLLGILLCNIQVNS